MKIAFNSPARRRLTAAITLVFAAGYLGLAGREFAASWLGNRGSLKNGELKRLEWAARLDPGDADYHDYLGAYYNVFAHEPGTALRHYRSAVQLNPHSASYWFDLAGAYQILGDTAGQAGALEHAIQADPMTPDVAWDAANLYLVQGENEKALREFRVVMANDASLASTAIQFCWRISTDVDLLLRDAVPPTAEAHLAFLTLLEAKQETAGTIKIWDALLQIHQPFEVQRAYGYFQFLIKHKEVNQAMLVWQQTAERFGLTSYLPSAANMVVNAGFNLDPLNAGLDWQYQRQSGVKLTLDPTDFHSGRRSLLVTFDGPGISDAGIYQFIPVQPGTHYNFSAYYKSAELQGAGGTHLTIQDMYSQAIYYNSDELTEAGFWKSVDGEFTTGTDCQLVVLHIRRLPAGSPIRGKLWVDDFRLARKPS